MRDRDIKRYLTIFFMIGFTIGIIYVNTIGREQILTYEVLSKEWIQEFSFLTINPEEYQVYILRLRLVPLILLIVCGLTKIKKIIVISFIIWTGLLTGVLITTAVAQLGVQGIILCLMGITPHFLCYIIVYIVVLSNLFHYPDSRWNITKTIFVLLLTAVGILLEIYVNPLIMKLFIQTI